MVILLLQTGKVLAAQSHLLVTLSPNIIRAEQHKNGFDSAFWIWLYCWANLIFVSCLWLYFCFLLQGAVLSWAKEAIWTSLTGWTQQNSLSITKSMPRLPGSEISADRGPPMLASSCVIKRLVSGLLDHAGSWVSCQGKGDSKEWLCYECWWWGGLASPFLIWGLEQRCAGITVEGPASWFARVLVSTAWSQLQKTHAGDGAWSKIMAEPVYVIH